MKQTITTLMLFISLSAFSQTRDTTGRHAPDSVMVEPESYKMSLQGPEIQLIIDKIDEQLRKLSARRQELLEMAIKQQIKKPR